MHPVRNQEPGLTGSSTWRLTPSALPQPHQDRTIHYAAKARKPSEIAVQPLRYWTQTLLRLIEIRYVSYNPQKFCQVLRILTNYSCDVLITTGDVFPGVLREMQQLMQ